MMITCKLCHTILFFSLEFSVVLSTSIIRDSEGDIFDASCNSCHLYNAFCADGGIHIFDCCTQCQCDYGATIYRDMCHDNLPQSELGCEIFLEKDEYFGLKTHQISRVHETNLGHIKSKWNSNRRVFENCTIDDESTYWDTRIWKKLFTDGRSITDFHITGGHYGVFLQAPWHIKNRWKLYTGLLIKLSITCISDHHIPHFGIDLSDVTYSRRQNGHHSLKSCLVTKFSGTRKYYEGTIAPPTPVTTRKPSPWRSTQKPFTKRVTTIKLSTQNITTKKHTTRMPHTVKTHIIPGSLTVHVCEHGVMELHCKSNETLHVVRAFYGRQSTSICPGPVAATEKTNCKAPKSQGVVKKLCSWKQQCSLKVDNSLFGDPCLGTTKYLQVTYICEPTDYGHIHTTAVTNMSTSAKHKSTKSGKITLHTHATNTPLIVIKGITYDELCRVAVPIVCVVILVLLFLFCIYCRRRCYRAGNKEEFVISYGSTDSGSLLNSNEYAVINSPTYSDIWELENWEKTRRNGDGPKVTRSTWKNDNAKYERFQDECDEPTLVAQESQSPRDVRGASESNWDGTIFMNGSYA